MINRQQHGAESITGTHIKTRRFNCFLKRQKPQGPLHVAGLVVASSTFRLISQPFRRLGRLRRFRLLGAIKHRI